MGSHAKNAAVNEVSWVRESLDGKQKEGFWCFVIWHQGKVSQTPTHKKPQISLRVLILSFSRRTKI